MHAISERKNIFLVYRTILDFHASTLQISTELDLNTPMGRITRASLKSHSFSSSKLDSPGRTMQGERREGGKEERGGERERRSDTYPVHNGLSMEISHTLQQHHHVTLDVSLQLP